MSLNVYEIITERIIQSLENNVVPWRTPWKSEAPKNLISKKPYRGVNVLLLSTARHTSPYWLTYRQARSKGGFVKKGEKSTPIIFWKVFSKDGGDGMSIPTEEGRRGGAVLRYYSVFNASQCEGIEVPASEEVDKLDFSPIEECERIVHGYATCPPIEEGGNQAAYNPNFDRIQMPPRENFTSEEAYYATKFHEMVHSTGHKDRLDRDGITKLDYFGSHQYSFEELIAECGSSFLCGEAGILDTTIDNSTAYIGGWVKKLHSNPKWIVQAGGQAAKAADYILGRDKNAPEQEGEEDA
jgi:antirestriction protein ArdC